MRVQRPNSIVVAALASVLIFLTVIVGYIVVLASAVFARPRKELVPRRTGRRFAVIIPAHNEATVIGSTLTSLSQLAYPLADFDVHVVADNCTDATAEVCRSFAGRLNLEVHERVNDQLRGKGYALSWFLDRLSPRQNVDAFVFLDADWTVSPTFLDVLDAYFAAGATVIQAHCRVANPDESWPTALRSIAFALVNYVRPLGLASLGTSCGLKGTGMAFTASIIRELGWTSHSLTEDSEEHIKLTQRGYRVTFAPEAIIESPMPTTLRQSQSQHLRWESGKIGLARAYTVPLAQRIISRRDGTALAELIGLWTPPLSVLVSLCVAVTAIAASLRYWRLTGWGLALVAGIGSYAVAGLLVARPSWTVVMSLRFVPVYVFWKLQVFAQAAARRGAGPWVRTSRAAEDRP
jgi:cellulose synthase/poly-beta-1,6-N-acetylglucosamine synthase-like glycosyltransferase